MISQTEKGAAFAQAHREAGIVVLPNAWDAGSAIMMVAAGFPFIATTSAGVAFTMGLADGERVERAQMLEHVARIVAAVDLPVSADLEGGYGRTRDDVAATVKGALAIGAVGCNIEDGTGESELLDVDLACDRIRAGAEAARGSGIPFTLNARTDPFLTRSGDPRNFAEAVERANRYRAVGADCVFVPGVKDRDTVRALVAEIDAPLNILAASGGSASPLSVRELAALGVKRVSIGSSLSLAALSVVQRALEELREAGTFSYTQSAMSHAAANRLMAEFHA